MNLLLKILLSAALVVCVFGHGRVVDPPSRNSIWRYDQSFEYPQDYDDDMLNCGGFGTQWDSVNKGKCGVCGDAWSNKNPQTIYPGLYYTGRIAKTYVRGQTIDLKLQITANHQGWHEFRVGKLGEPPMTHAKLTHVLELADGSGTKWKTPPGLKIFDIKLKLPKDLFCDHCVMQWYWRAGNNWGCDKTGCGNGKNPQQETFINCIDIAILSDPSQTPPPQPVTPPPRPPTKRPTPTENPPRPPTKPPAGTCRATGPHKGNPSMDKWCESNCKVGYCPSSICSC